MTMAAVGISTAVATVGMGAYQMIDGKKQQKKAQEAMDSLRKPVYQIPQEILDNLSDAEKRQVEGLGAEQKQEYVKNIERSRQSYLKNSADRKAGLAGLQDSTNRANDQYTNLVSQDALMKQQNKKAKEQEIATARAGVANAKDQKFAFNMSDYQQQLTAAQGNYQAGGQNFNTGLSMAISGVTSAAGAYGQAKMNGAGKTGNTSTPRAASTPNSMNTESTPDFNYGNNTYKV